MYLGNLHPFVTEIALQEIFAGIDGITELKVIKDKATGVSAGYGFAKFVDQNLAQRALDVVGNKCILFGQEVRVNWAFIKEHQDDIATHYHVFVGDLSPDVNDAILLAAFRACPGCSDARVMWDHATGRSRGFGFVSFKTKEDAAEAIATMHNQFVGARRVRCGWAQHKTESALPSDPHILDRVDPTNTNVYIGNLPSNISDADIRHYFGSFGPTVEVKLHKKGGFGFVRYKSHEDAVRAILNMNGATFEGKQLKCSWGRHPNTPPSGVKTNLMLAAAAGINPMAMAGPAPGTPAMMAPLGGVNVLGMPLAAAGAQGMMQAPSGLRQQGQSPLGLLTGDGSVVPLDSQQMYGAPAAYGMASPYSNVGQMYFPGQPPPQG